MTLLVASVLLPGEPQAYVEVLWQDVHHNHPMQGPARIHADQDVWLSPLVVFADGTCAVRTGAYLDGQGGLHVCDRMEDGLRDLKAVWMRLEPAVESHPRSSRGVGPPLPYVTTTWATLGADKRVLADFRPAWSREEGDAAEVLVGTLRFVVRIEERDGQPVGQSAGESNPAGALTLHVRSGEDLVGRVEELHFVPYADSPRGAPPENHETEQALCVDGETAVLYGARRLGLPVGYSGLGELDPYLLPVVTTSVRRGDLVRRGAFVGLLAEDRGKVGTLDGEDLVLTASGGPLRTVRVQDLPGEGPLHLHRLRLPRAAPSQGRMLPADVNTLRR